MAREPFSTIRRLVEESTRKRMEMAARYLKDRLIENASLTDHSLEELRKMGHPYRHGGTPPHTPVWLVHKQSGELADNVEVWERETPKGTSFDIGIDAQKVPYIQHVLFGTEKMISRDFITGTWQEEREKVRAILRGEDKYEPATD